MNIACARQTIVVYNRTRSGSNYWLGCVETPPFEAYFIVQGLAKTKALSGDVCEFGVAQGETSALIANEIQPSNKSLHLFDSFEGLPKPTEKDKLKDDIFSLGSMEAYEGTMSSPEIMVRTRLGSISFPENRTVIHKGFIDKVLKNASNLPQKVSFAYVDFDFL
jgi:O-methyltransferase